MAYSYNLEQMQQLLFKLLKENTDEQAVQWLKKQLDRYQEQQKISAFNLTFTAMPRFMGKNAIDTKESALAAIQALRPGLDLTGWTTDRLARSWWLLQLPVAEKAVYVAQLTNLFKAAEMNEQVALYGSLPLLAYPEAFVRQAAEGVRTNIGVVFDAIVLHNPFPSEYMDEAAWNQVVLKAFFMGRPVNQIIGLDERANKALASILSDYAHERWAAGRTVDPLLWRPVGPFIDEAILPDLQRLFRSEDELDQKAAALACSHSTYGPAMKLLEQYPIYEAAIEKKTLRWQEFD